MEYIYEYAGNNCWWILNGWYWELWRIEAKTSTDESYYESFYIVRG